MEPFRHLFLKVMGLSRELFLHVLFLVSHRMAYSTLNGLGFQLILHPRICVVWSNVYDERWSKSLCHEEWKELA